MPQLVAAAAVACVLAACGGGGGGDDGLLEPTDAQVPTDETKVIQTEGAVTFAEMSTDTTLIVHMEPDYSIGPVATWAGGQKSGQLDERPIYLLSFQSPADATRALANINLNQGNLHVRYVEPNLPVFTAEHQPGSIGNSVVAIGLGISGGSGWVVTKTGDGWAPKLLQLARVPSTAGAGVRVAVLDTGVNHLHGDLLHHVAFRSVDRVLGYDFVNRDSDPREVLPVDGSDGAYGHGTHVAGIIAATAPGARLMPVRVLDDQGKGSLWTVAKGAIWALDPDKNPKTDDGAAVLNASFGTGSESKTLQVIADIAGCAANLTGRSGGYRSLGFETDRVRCESHLPAVVVAGAGNAANAPSLWPARLAATLQPGLLSVTSIDRYLRLSEFATRDTAVLIAAPGDHISSSYAASPTTTISDYAMMSGTSMAAPWVAGAAALVLSTLPAMSDRHVYTVNRILSTTSPLCDYTTSLRQVNPLAALSGRLTTMPCASPPL